jgi:hypothetical protein
MKTNFIKLEYSNLIFMKIITNNRLLRMYEERIYDVITLISLAICLLYFIINLPYTGKYLADFSHGQNSGGNYDYGNL